MSFNPIACTGYSCFVAQNKNTLFSWGSGTSGQLGTGVLEKTQLATKVTTNVSNIKQIEASKSCFFLLKNNGKLFFHPL